MNGCLDFNLLTIFLLQPYLSHQPLSYLPIPLLLLYGRQILSTFVTVGFLFGLHSRHNASIQVQCPHLISQFPYIEYPINSPSQFINLSSPHFELPDQARIQELEALVETLQSKLPLQQAQIEAQQQETDYHLLLAQVARKSQKAAI